LAKITYGQKEKSFEEMFQSINPMFCLSRRIWKPQMDIFETRREIVIQAEIAGVRKEDIVIEQDARMNRWENVRWPRDDP
jgi:HSP20 family protein